ncbi:MAG: SOS response-associated peptidase [Renibacterium salmoninarum]|nr:SOS response-associated peptidase [Renibacterium salmoninarum]
MEIEDLVGAFDARAVDVGEWRPKGSVNITSMPPVLFEQLSAGGEIERVVTRARWRFVPEREEDFRAPPLTNARLDKITRWSGWKDSFARHRLIVPMTGYYEFVEMVIDGKKVKQPYFIHDPDGEILLAAGLYNVGHDPKADYTGLGFTIITTDGVDAAGEVHDRMPVFLPPDAVDDWLQPGDWDVKARKAWKERLGTISVPVSRRLVAHPTSRALNNTRTVRVDDLSLMDPIELPED